MYGAHSMFFALPTLKEIFAVGGVLVCWISRVHTDVNILHHVRIHRTHTHTYTLPSTHIVDVHTELV